MGKQRGKIRAAHPIHTQADRQRKPEKREIPKKARSQNHCVKKCVAIFITTDTQVTLMKKDTNEKV